MKPYVIKQGDYLTKLAHAMGFDADEVWDHPKNAELKARRPNSDLLCPGDILFVPDKSRQGLPFQPGKVNRYIARVPKVLVKIVIQSDGKPIIDEPFIVEGLNEPIEGKTGGDGSIELTIPIHVREVRIVLYEKNLVYPVRVGDLDPIEEPSGVRMRLLHLGYYGFYPPHDALAEEHDREAITAFQSARGIEPTGVMDTATRDALREAHGG